MARLNILCCFVLVDLGLTIPMRADQPSETSALDYRAVRGWPTLPPDFQWGAVSAVATDSADRVFVFHRGTHPIMVFDNNGKFIRTWGDDLIKNAHGLRIDREDNVWITDTGHHQVMKFGPKGKLLMSLGRKDQPGDGHDQFNKPTDVAFTSTGEFYVSDGYGNSRVVKFARDGTYLMEWGKKGTGHGEFNLPHAIRIDREGHVYVGDRENHRIQIFDPDGHFIAQWTQAGTPYGLYVTKEGRIFVADALADWIMVLDSHGKVLGRFGEKGTGPGNFQVPHGITVDSQGAVYVAEIIGKRVQKLLPR